MMILITMNIYRMIDMPVTVSKKKYKNFKSYAASIKKKKGLSKERAAAYAASVLRKTGDLPKPKKKKITKKRKKKS